MRRRRWWLEGLALILLLLSVAVSAPEAVPLEVVEARALRAGEVITIVLPLDSGLKEWRLVGSDPALVEVREQQVTPFSYILTVAGLAGGEARLVLQQSYTLPPETVLERRIVRLRIAGPPRAPGAADTAVAQVAAEADTRLAALFRLLQARHGDTAAVDSAAAMAAMYPAPERIAVGAIQAQPAAPAVRRTAPARAAGARRRDNPADWVVAPGELVDGQPRRERLTLVLGWLALADELYRENFNERAQVEYERAMPFILPDETAARVRCGLAECRYRVADRTGAMERYREVLAKYPHTAWRDRARLRLGQLLMENDNYPEAVREFMWLRAEAGGTQLAHEAHFHLAQCYARLLRYDDALREFAGAARADGRAEWQARSWYEMAKIYDYVPALRDYYRALELYRMVTTGEQQTAAAERARFIAGEYL